MKDSLLQKAPPPSSSAVAVTAGTIGLHAGLVFRGSDDTCHVLHLAWHYKLRCDSNLDEWLCVTPTIDPIELQVLAALCVTLDSVRPRIPYGLRFSESTFDEEGRFVPGSNETGLTCSTFVMAVFDWARIALLARETWPVREEDITAQKNLLRALQETNDATREHVVAVERELGCMRYRPEEVAVASAMEHRPVLFDAASHAAQELLLTFDTYSNLREP